MTFLPAFDTITELPHQRKGLNVDIFISLIIFFFLLFHNETDKLKLFFHNIRPDQNRRSNLPWGKKASVTNCGRLHSYITRSTFLKVVIRVTVWSNLSYEQSP